MEKVLIIISFLSLLTNLSSEAQKKNIKVLIEVDGVCMMCKKRIEIAALNSVGVKFANWNVKTHQLFLIIDENKTDVKIIQKNIALVGHDTKEIKAKDSVYNKIDLCCKYRNKEVAGASNKQ